MSVAAAQASAFYKEVAINGKVWTVRDAGGFPAPLTSSGVRAHPFWSSESRVRKIIANVPAYSTFEPVMISWKDFREHWLPGMTTDGMLVGVNWSGSRAMGYDVAPPELQRNVEYQISLLR